VVSGSESRRDILLALEAGVHGYMPKTLGIAELASALRTVLNGSIYVPPSLADIASLAPEPLGEPAQTPAPIQSNSVSPLTPRQREVLDLVVKGKTNKEIALTLKLGEGTVKIHMVALFRYFGVNTRAAAAVAGARPYMKRRSSRQFG
jgi:DNA-binding NarL/FixJ family response regulator